MEPSEADERADLPKRTTSATIDVSELLDPEGLLAVRPHQVFDKRDVYDPSPLFAAAYRRFGEAPRRNEAGECFSAELFLSLRDEINAYAAKLKGTHYVGITCKQLLFSRFAAESALFWDTIFFDIKAPLEEADERARLLKMRDQAQTIAKFVDLMGTFERAFARHDLVPLLSLFDSHDRKRRLAAWYIAQSCVLLALRHELVHGVNGHCALAEAANAEGRFCVFNEVRRFEAHLDGDTLRSMELEADFDAAAMCVFDIIQAVDPLDSVIPTNFDVETRIALSTFAMCSSAIFWHSETKQGRDDGVHPHPLTRVYTFLNGIFAVAELSQSKDVGDVVGRGVKRALQSMFLYAEINPDYADVARVADERTFRREYAETSIVDLDALKPFAYWDRKYKL